MPRAAINGHVKPASPPPPAVKPSAKPAPAAAAAAHEPTTKLTLSLALIGELVRQMLPANASTKELAAMDYWGASVTAQYAEAWRNRAKRAAIIGGVLPDTVFPIGTAETVYQGSMVTVGLKVVAQANRVDVPGLVADLERAGVAPKVLKRLVTKHTIAFPGAHVFSPSING